MKDPTSPLSRGLTSFSLTFPGVIIVFGKDSPGREKEIGESRDSLSLAIITPSYSRYNCT